MHKTKLKFVSYAKERCSIPSVVFPLVYAYISRVKERGRYTSNLLKTIKTAIKSEKWEENFNALDAIMQNNSYFLSSLEFSPRNITPDIISSINWYITTGHYNKDDTCKILSYIAKNEEEWLLMLDAIIKAAKEYEWEYNQTLDYYVDENGQWCQDTPISLKPFYQFCDEIRGKFCEISMSGKAINLNINSEDITIENTFNNHANKQSTNSCFRHTNLYVKQKVKDIVSQYHDGVHANLALIELELFNKEWLKRGDRHKAFIKELISWMILSSANEEEIKKMAQGIADKMRDIRNSGPNINDNKIIAGIDRLLESE